jgi:hypothetical protein
VSADAFDFGFGLKFDFFAANRVTTMHDFGYVALNMKFVYPEDSGTYTCRAINELGQAVTSSQMICQCKYFERETKFLTENEALGNLRSTHVMHVVSNSKAFGD